MITICLMQHISFAYRVDCGLWNVDPLLFNGSVKLLDITSNWNTLLHMPIQNTVLTRVKTLTQSIPIARSLKTCSICGIVLCDKTAHFLEWPFIVTSPRQTCVLIILFNQYPDPDMPHPSGEWINLEKEKCSLTQI